VFKINSSKLAYDKGYVVNRESLRKDLESVKPSINKSKTVGKVASRPISHFSNIKKWKNPMRQHTGIIKFKSKEIDSPDILRALMKSHKKNNGSSIMIGNGWEDTELNRFLIGQEVGKLSENSRSVSM
jgi:hypothetical protein